MSSFSFGGFGPFTREEIQAASDYIQGLRADQIQYEFDQDASLYAKWVLALRLGIVQRANTDAVGNEIGAGLYGFTKPFTAQPYNPFNGVEAQGRHDTYHKDVL